MYTLELKHSKLRQYKSGARNTLELKHSMLGPYKSGARNNDSSSVHIFHKTTTHGYHRIERQ